ncbi:hypothetical protein [Pedobacter nanyangensis]|uniref:hypothetical protein n=1 Tax=Pedobacter nanyangensis TaxID=1562389 RepID=UPI0013B3BA8E|nr:hypothetical protein [Pedobacter nanyangensis]
MTKLVLQVLALPLTVIIEQLLARANTTFMVQFLNAQETPNLNLNFRAIATR